MNNALAEKYKISTALMMENPVRSPMVPPIADNISTNFAARSLVILSNVGVSKYILTYFNLVSIGGSKSSLLIGYKCKIYSGVPSDGSKNFL